jgi:hypothetical protein
VEIRSEIGKRSESILKRREGSLVRRLPRVDVFFHDDLHTPEHMKWEYDLVWSHLAPGGVLISDDDNYGWLRFCREKRLPRFRALNLQRLTVACRLSQARRSPGSQALRVPGQVSSL